MSSTPPPSTAAAARLDRAGPDLRPVAGLDRIAPPQPVRFIAMPKKAAMKLWHRARDFDRGTRQPGHHGGALEHTGLAVLHALIFDVLNHRTGRLEPSYEAIAAKAGVCVHTVATALQRLCIELGDPQLGAPLRRKLAGRAVRARAGDQRMPRRANGVATGLQRSRQGRRRARGENRRPCCCRRLPRRRWSAIWRARCRRAGLRPEGPAGCGSGAAGPGVHGPRLVSFPGVHEMRRNPPQR